MKIYISFQKIRFFFDSLSFSQMSKKKFVFSLKKKNQIYNYTVYFHLNVGSQVEVACTCCLYTACVKACL